MKEPLVSVIISAYNCEKYIEESINSILNQTYKNIEILLVDDNSTDNTVKKIKKVIQGKKNVKFIQNTKNLGLTKNLNKLIEISNGEYIARMDADDVSDLTRIEKQVQYLINNPKITIIGSFGKYINERNELEEYKKMPISNDEIVKIMPKVNPIIHPSVMYRKNEIVRIGMYDERFKKVQDYDLWFRAMSNNLKFYNIPEALILLRRDRNYNKRKSKKYRVIDLKVRINGYKINKLNFKKYIYLIIPIALIILPSKFVDKYFYKLKKLDPREKR